VPHAVDVALPSRVEYPALDYPPICTFWFSGRAWSEGIQTCRVDDTAVRIYNPEKSVADSWKYRHKLGLDVALEALKLYHQRRDFDVTRLVEYARRVACRVEKVMRPYPEALM
jgi:hypothetical protein